MYIYTCNDDAIIYCKCFIACTGEDICHIDQFITVAEKEIVNETNSLWKAIASMVTWYYIVDIVYPPVC